MSSFTEYMEIILEGQDLDFDQAKDMLDIIFTGEVHELQIAAFLAAMRVKKATAAEIAGLARSLRDHAVPVQPKVDYMIDTCGTGGAKIKTFNISTASAFVAAGGGAYVAKHGNRAITSKCGSADVLSELGVKVDAAPDVIEKCIEDAHIGFMFAPMFHPAMKFVQPIRKTLDFRTAFNILGPLANPANANAQVMGVADESLMDRIIESLKLLGLDSVMVVHSEGLDEISTMDPTKIARLKGEKIEHFKISADDFGMETASITDLKGVDAGESAKIIRDILDGSEKGAKRDIVVLNSAAAIMAAGLADDFNEGIELANKSIDTGSANSCMEKLIEISNG